MLLAKRSHGEYGVDGFLWGLKGTKAWFSPNVKVFNGFNDLKALGGDLACWPYLLLAFSPSKSLLPIILNLCMLVLYSF